MSYDVNRLPRFLVRGYAPLAGWFAGWLPGSLAGTKGGWLGGSWWLVGWLVQIGDVDWLIG